MSIILRTGLTWFLTLALSSSVSADDHEPTHSELSVSETGVQVFAPEFYAEYRPENAFSLVYNTPGFQLETGDQGRGLAGTEGNVLFNGVRPPPRGTSIHTRLSSIRYEDVIRIELIEAGARDIDMQGYPNLVNIVTDTQSTRQISGRFQTTQQEDGGERFNLNLRGNLSAENYEAQFSLQRSNALTPQYGSFLTSSSFSPEPRMADDNLENFEWQNLDGSGSIDLGEKTRLSLSSTLHTMNFQALPIDTQLPGGSSNTVRQLFEFDVDSKSVSLDLRSDLSDDLNFSLVLALKDSSNGNASSLQSGSSLSTFSNTSDSGENALRSALRWNMSGDIVIEGGATWAFNFLEGTSASSLNGVTQIIDGSQARVEEVRTAALGSISWTPSEQFSATLGGRIERFDLQSSNAPGQSFELTDIIPRATLNYTFDNDWVIRLKSEREVAQLSLGRFLASTNLTTEINTSGAQLLEPERNWINEITLERRFDERGLFRLQAIQEDIDNPISTVPQSDGSLRPVNIGPEWIRTLSGELELPLDRFGFAGAVLEMEGQLKDSDRIDPLTGRNRNTSGHSDYEWDIELRHEIENTDYIWGFRLSDDAPATHFWLTQIREQDESPVARIYLEWRPRVDLRGGVSTRISQEFSQSVQIFDGIRAPTAQPVFTQEIDRDHETSFGAWVEWEARDGVKLTVRGDTGRSRFARSDVDDPDGINLYQAQRDYEAVPSISFQLRFDR